MSAPAPNTIANRDDAMAKSRTIMIEIEVNTSKFNAAITRIHQRLDSIGRGVARRSAQAKRDRATRPISDERREIQAIGRRQMAEAVAQFKASTKRRGWDCGCEALVVDAPAMAGWDTTDCVEHGRAG